MSVSAWEPDPTGRHQYRWWDGEGWTDQVADDGVQTVDPVSTAEARLPEDALPSMPPPSSPAPEATEEQLDSGAPDPLLVLSSQGKRLGAFVLEVLLFSVTLIVGWLIWALVIYPRGQSPAKQLLKMRVIRLDDNQPPEIGWMALRELVLKAIPSIFILGLLWVAINGIVLLTNDRYQTLWDKMLKTVVVDDPGNQFRPPPSHNRLWDY